MKKQIYSLMIGAAAFLGSTLIASADPALLGNKSLSGQKLDDDAAKAVLMGKNSMLGGSRVVIVIVKGSDAQEAYLKDHVGMTTDQFQTYWRRLFMTGGGSAPKTAESEAEAIKLAAETPGAVVVGDSAKADGLVVLNK